MKKIILLSLLFIFYSNIKAQENLNKGLFEHEIISQKLKLYDNKFYIKINNNFIYYYNKSDGHRVKVVKGDYKNYQSNVLQTNAIIYNGVGIMYNLKLGYTVYTKYDWENYYRGKVSKTNDSGKTWLEIADFDEIFKKYYHKTEKLFLLDSNYLIVYGMRCKYESKYLPKPPTIKSNIELSCLPNREGYVNVYNFKHIIIENFIYVSKDGGVTWEEAKVPDWFKKGFKYVDNGENLLTLKSDMYSNSLIWFERKVTALFITTKHFNREIISYDNGLNWE